MDDSISQQLLNMVQAVAADAAAHGSTASVWKQYLHKLKDPWVWFGLGAQFVYMVRMLIQWFESERRRRSHVPVAFWWFSCIGGVMLLVYATRNKDIVIMLGQGAGLIIYVRNLMLIYARRWRFRERRERLATLAAAQRETRAAEARGALGTVSERM